MAFRLNPDKHRLFSSKASMQSANKQTWLEITQILNAAIQQCTILCPIPNFSLFLPSMEIHNDVQWNLRIEKCRIWESYFLFLGIRNSEVGSTGDLRCTDQKIPWNILWKSTKPMLGETCPNQMNPSESNILIFWMQNMFQFEFDVHYSNNSV